MYKKTFKNPNLSFAKSFYLSTKLFVNQKLDGEIKNLKFNIIPLFFNLNGK